MKRSYKNLIMLLLTLLIICINTYSQRKYFQIYADGNLKMLIINPLGKKLGYDPNTNSYFNEIPRSSIGAAGIDFISADGEPELNESQLNPIEAIVNEVIDGKYQVVISGKSLAFYSVNFRTRDSHRKVIGSSDEGIIDSLQSISFNLTFSSISDIVFDVKKVVSSFSIQQQIGAALKLNLIANTGIANSLQQKLDNARKQKEKGQIKAAVNLLQAFINEVKAQREKGITKDAADLLITDAEQLVKEWSALK